MLVTVDGIVIGSRSIGENSSYLDILTNDFGVIEVTAHGIKKLNSKNAGSTALFSYSTFCLSKNGLKYSINSASPKYSFHKLSEDIFSFSLAFYFAEVIKYTSASEQTANANNSELRLLAITLYELIEKKVPETLIKAVFELRLMTVIGLMPDLRICVNCFCYEHEDFYFILEDGILICDDCYFDAHISPEKNVFHISPKLLHIMRYICYSPIDKLYKFTIGADIISEIAVLCEKYVLYHLERNFKTLDYYKKL